jgi:peptidoglycan/LPS O-acetylase OafA/YrhL
MAFQWWAFGAMGLVWNVIHAEAPGDALSSGLAARLIRAPIKALQWVGAFSYSLYIVHQPIVIAFVALVVGGQSAVIWPTVMCLVVIIVFAYAFHCAFERPFLRMLERDRPGSVVAALPIAAGRR